MKVIITEEQLKYIANQELLNEGIDEGAIWRLLKSIPKAAGAIARGGANIAGQAMKNKNGVAGKAGQWFLKQRPKAGAITNFKGIPFVFDGKVWKTLNGKKIIKPNWTALNTALNSQVKMISNAERIGKAAEIGTAGAMIGGAAHAGKKIVGKFNDRKNGYNSLRNSRVAENPDMPANTNTGTAQDVLQSMGFNGTGQSIFQPKNPDSTLGRLYDKYGKNQ